MAATLTKLLVHVIYSTKCRADLIPLDHESALYAYTGGICRRMRSPLLAMNGTSNHVHLLISLSKSVTLAELMLNVKRDTSMWLKERDASLRGFRWQDGYFGFSIGEFNMDALRRYIGGQKEHHRRVGFQEEVRLLLRKYGIECKEEYIWE